MENHYIPLALKNMPLSKAVSVLAVDLLKNIEQRSQLLVERGYNDKGQAVMAFSHLTFQEYLSSVALKEATSKDGEAVISEQLISDYEQDPEHWEEVALLYAAQLDGPQQQAFFKRIYPEARTV